MTTTEPFAEPGQVQPYTGACPRCGGPLATARAACPTCRLDLNDPLVAQLSDLNRRHQALRQQRTDALRSIDGQLTAIEDGRSEVLSALSGHPHAHQPSQAWAHPTGSASAVDPTTPSSGTDPSRTDGSGTNGWGTQTLLLALGVLCLTIAAAVFAAVGWDRLGQWGQASVLLAATAAAGFGGVAFFRRGLRATGEALLALGSVMVLVDIAAFGSALGVGTGDLRFWGIGLTILAGLGAASWRWGAAPEGNRPLAGGMIAAVAAQLPLSLAVLAATGGSTAAADNLSLWDPHPTQPGIAGLAVVGIVQALVVTLAVRERNWSATSPVAITGMLTAAGGWVAAIGLSLSLSEVTAMAAILTGAGLVAAVAATLRQLDDLAATTTAGAASAAVLGAWTALAPSVPSPTIWIAIGASLVLLAARSLTTRYSAGPTIAAGFALLGTAWVLLAAVFHALARFGDLVGDVPTAGPPSWYSWVDVAVVACITAAAIIAGWPGSTPPTIRGRALPTAAALGGYALAVAPALLGATAPAWASILAITAAASTASAVLTKPGSATSALGWSVSVATVPASLLLVHDLQPAVLAGLVVITLGATGIGLWLASLDRASEATLLFIAAASTAVFTASYTAWLASADAHWIGVTAAITSSVIAIGATAVMKLAGDLTAGVRQPGRDGSPPLLPTWMSELVRPTLAVALALQSVAILWAVGASIDLDSAAPGVVALLSGAVAWFTIAGIANQPRAAAAGAAHTQVAAWLLLSLAGVSVVEAYTMPGALILLAIGAWWLTTNPTVSSWSALAPALSIGFGPTTLLALADDAPRSLAVIAAAALAVGVGAVLRLAAPVIIGGICLVGLSLIEVAPIVGALPRYLTFGLAGAALLLLGATFEKRRAELAAVNRQLQALR